MHGSHPTSSFSKSYFLCIVKKYFWKAELENENKCTLAEYYIPTLR